MALNKQAKTILAAVSVPAGSTKTALNAQGTGTAVDCTLLYGGELTWKITNGATAPGTALTLTFQASHDGANWYDYYTVAGDLTNGSVNSGSLILDRGVMWLRAIAYANTTQAVTVESYLQAVTSL